MSDTTLLHSHDEICFDIEEMVKNFADDLAPVLS